MAELTRGFCEHSPWAGAPTQHPRSRQGLAAEQPMGKPRATERCSGYVHYLFMRTEKQERIKKYGRQFVNSAVCAQRLDTTKPVAVLGDMAVLEAGLARTVLIWGGLLSYRAHLCEQRVDSDRTRGLDSAEAEGGKATHSVLIIQGF